MVIFEKTGAGTPLLLIHGFCESKEMWTTFAQELAKSHTVYCIDLPGISDDLFKHDRVNLEKVAVILHDWMDENRILNPVVIGHSLGGYVTLALAELMGSDLKAIGLFHSTAFSDDAEKKKTRDKTITFVRKFGVDKFMDTLVAPLFSEEHRITQEKQINQLIAMGKKWSLEGIVTYVMAMRDRKNRMDVWENFPNPKLMIAGNLDAAIKIEDSRKHQSSSTQFHELKGVGHMGMFEAEKESLELVKSFLVSG